MKKFAIITDSCSDLDKALREEYDIDYVPMHFIINEKDYLASLDWDEVSAPDFYNMMKDGTRILTAQVSMNDYREKFEKYINEGYDILSISCSSALSASVKASYTVRDELQAKYPEAKIICIDSLIACIGLGMICIMASELRAEGKSIEEVAEWIEENKLTINQEGAVDKLTYLKQAGRVSATSAFFGGLLNIKPILISDKYGRNLAVEKVKGRRASIDRVVERLKERFVSTEKNRVFIGHANCVEDAEIIKEELIKTMPNEKLDVHIGYIGPIVGATVGPGMLGVYFVGKKVTEPEEE